MTPTLISNAEQSTANIFSIYDGWMINPKIDIFYKVITVAGVFIAAGAVPPLQRFVGWTAAALGLLILLSGKAQPSQPATTAPISAASSSAPPSAHFVPPGVSW